MPQHRPGTPLVTACAALGGSQLGFMEVKPDISPQPPVVRNDFFWKDWERETGLLGMKMQTKGSLMKPFEKCMMNIIQQYYLKLQDFGMGPTFWRVLFKQFKEDFRGADLCMCKETACGCILVDGSVFSNSYLLFGTWIPIYLGVAI